LLFQLLDSRFGIAPIIEEILDRYLDPVRLILSALSRHFLEFSVITSHIDRAFSAAWSVLIDQHFPHARGFDSLRDQRKIS